MVIEMAESFGGNAVNLILLQKKGHPIQFALNGTRGATGKHLKANDLIKASQATPLTQLHKSYLLITK